MRPDHCVGFASQSQQTRKPVAANSFKRTRPWKSPDGPLYELSRKVHELTKAGKIEQAEAVFTELWNYQPTSQDHSYKAKQIGLCTQQLFLSYRRLLEIDIVEARQQRIVKSARALFKRVETLEHLNHRRSDSRRILLITLVDIYARAGKYEEAEDLVKENQDLDTTILNILLKAFGKHDPVKANEFLLHMLQSKNVRSIIDIQSFNTVISAWVRQNWRIIFCLSCMLKNSSQGLSVSIFSSCFRQKANSSASDKYEQALSVFELIEQKHFQPDNFTYSGLLLCLSKSVPILGADAAQYADHILDQIDRQRRQKLVEGETPTVELDANIYNLAMKVFLESGDQKRAKYLMDIMEKSQKFNLRTYSEILNSWSRAAAEGVPEAAEKAEKVLEHIKNLSKSRPDLKPSTYQYTIVMTAWKNGTKDTVMAAQRIWNLYADMQNESVPLSIVTVTLMIAALSASLDIEMLARADQLLKSVEQIDVPSDLRPDHRHYLPLISAYLVVGDAEKATEIIFRSIHLYKVTKNREVLLDAITMDRVMNAWRRKGDLLSATQFIQQLLKKYDEANIQEMPSQRTIKCLSDSWKKSSHPERFKYIALLQSIQYHESFGEANQNKKEKSSSAS
jgi:tetratricopeptide (TPR) repeat protein